MRRGAAALAAALLLAAAAVPAATLPQPPYYSVQLGSAPDRTAALQKLQAFKDVPHVRAERRRSGWLLRAGAWTTRAEAEAALPALRAQGAREARVLSMETNVAWLLPDGTTLTPGATAARSPSGAGPAAGAAAPAPAPAPSSAGPAFIPIPPPPPARPVATELQLAPEFRTAAGKLDAEMRRWLRVEGAQRRDGYLYALDVATLLLYAAQRGDQTLYLQLLPEARKLIVDDARDPYTRGFVLVRRRSGGAPDLTGATDALWLARALWQGAAAFGRADDRALALQVLEGYARHAYELQGVWLVRKYFAFDGRAFAGLSTLASYHPDFLGDVEREVPRDAWRGFAERSYAALERARAPSDLLYPLIQPEVGATWPELAVTAYAPNALVALADSCAGAAGGVRGRPALADGLLRFVSDDDRQVRTGRLYAYFNSHTGAPVGRAELPATGYACLGYLAAARNDRRSFDRLASWLQLSMNEIASVPSVQTAPLYEGGQLLLAAYAAGAFNP